MIRLNNVRMDIEDNDIKNTVCSTLKIDEDKILGIDIIRKSIDARYNSIKFIYTLDIKINYDEDKIVAQIKNANYTPKKNKWKIKSGNKKIKHRPIIIGAGPAGLFAAIILSEYGYNPIIIERGAKVKKRTLDVKDFFENSKLNINSNISFGEGGAGTFSDGKLKTRISDMRCFYVLEKLCRAGAPSDIFYEAHPHVGSDILKIVIANLRKEVICNGGEFIFDTTIDDIIIKDDKIAAIKYKDEMIDVNCVILAIGHSAKDTYQMLYDRGVAMIQKPFAMGVRIEHPREFIDNAMYHDYSGNKMLGAASYSLNVNAKGKKVYTFCMCPGGIVVNSANREGALCVNGMSNHKRNSDNSNSAIVTGITSDMTKGTHALSGMYYQMKFEQRAFKLGGSNYNVPSMRLADFLSGDKPKPFEVMPSVMPKAFLCDIKETLPNDVYETIKYAIPKMAERIVGFDMGGAVLSAVESRTSSPVRILRGDDFMSVNVKGLYPAGEGAGYAGGIISSAVDGLRAAGVIIEEYSPDL